MYFISFQGQDEGEGAGVEPVVVGAGVEPVVVGAGVEPVVVGAGVEPVVVGAGVEPIPVGAIVDVVVVFPSTVVTGVVVNLLSIFAICSCRALYRLLRVPRVAAASANVITENKATIPIAINTRVLIPSVAINSSFIEKRNEGFIK